MSDYCGDCYHFWKCSYLIQATQTRTECDWNPSRFIRNRSWVPVEKYLPREDQQVLVIHDNPCSENIMEICFFKDSGWWLSPTHMLDRQYEQPLYWMPLPEPPQPLPTNGNGPTHQEDDDGE
jgi:hypothetical protein